MTFILVLTCAFLIVLLVDTLGIQRLTDRLLHWPAPITEREARQNTRPHGSVSRIFDREDPRATGSHGVAREELRLVAGTSDTRPVVTLVPHHPTFNDDGPFDRPVA